jgi:hypothetical protein
MNMHIATDFNRHLQSVLRGLRQAYAVSWKTEDLLEFDA